MASFGIVGSGIGGIALAIRMAVLGQKVDVFEANAYPGGKLCQIEVQGFRFDAGPSLFTLPNLVDELFTLAGKTLGIILITKNSPSSATIFGKMEHGSIHSPIYKKPPRHSPKN